MTSHLSWRWVWMTALIAAAVGSFGILTRTDDGADTGEGRLQQPGYYLDDARLVVTQPDGSERLTLTAARIEENVADRSYLASDVRMDYRAAAARPWTLRADQAAVPAALQTVDLRGNVEVRGLDAGTAGIIRTERLSLDLERDIATTDAPVEIEFAGRRLMATGLRADLGNETLQLASAVHGRFE